MESTKIITGEEVREFYNSLGLRTADKFRDEVKEKCDWTARMWQTRLKGETKITKLESEAIIPIMFQYKN